MMFQKYHENDKPHMHYVSANLHTHTCIIISTIRAVKCLCDCITIDDYITQYMCLKHHVQILLLYWEQTSKAVPNIYMCVNVN
jgi:hypothetical protein